MKHIIFVAPFFMETTLRFIKGAALLPETKFSLIAQDLEAKLPSEIREHTDGFRQVANALDPDILFATIEELAAEFGPPHRIFGSLEELQIPLAEVRQRLGVEGMNVEAANNFRDKHRMKNRFQEAGIPCARHSLVGSAEEANSFLEQVGYPVVVKPPSGAGARNTFRLESETDLQDYLVKYRPDPDDPTLFEEFMTGREHSFDSVFVGGKSVWYSISRYYPTPLEVMENPWIQWCVVLPREVESDEYADIRTEGARALQALGMGTGLSHMEWFRRPDGTLAISEVAARPPGAQFVTLISYAHNLDFYRAWPRLMAFDEFEVPARPYAAGAVFLRGQGRGKVKEVHGLDKAKSELGDLMVEARLPRAGQTSSGSYEGDGYVIVRHPDTEVVEKGLARIVKLIRVELD